MSKRPLSPHLTIYRPQISSVLSIFHRIAGVILFVGALLVVAWLAVAAYHPSSYGNLYECAASPLGQLVLLAFTLAFYYHFCNGIRHLFWDIGKGFTLPQMTRSGLGVLFFTAFFTAATWVFALGVVGK